jgi:hypothetical protein
MAFAAGSSVTAFDVLVAPFDSFLSINFSSMHRLTFFRCCILSAPVITAVLSFQMAPFDVLR